MDYPTGNWKITVVVGGIILTLCLAAVVNWLTLSSSVN